MTDIPKKVVFASMGAAGLVALMCVLDIILGFPFAGQMVMDILFIIGSGVVLYLGWDALQEMK